MRPSGFSKWADDEAKHAYWHSSAHLMAEAVEALFPGTKFGIGPAIETGFYYDIDMGDHSAHGRRSRARSKRKCGAVRDATSRTAAR